MAPELDLKKKMSFHFRWLSKSSRPPPPTPIPEELPLAPRGPYKPKHAAADFSRMPVSSRVPPSSNVNNARTYRRPSAPVFGHTAARPAIHYPSGRRMTVGTSDPDATAQEQIRGHTPPPPIFLRSAEAETEADTGTVHVPVRSTGTDNVTEKYGTCTLSTNTLVDSMSLSIPDSDVTLRTPLAPPPPPRAPGSAPPRNPQLSDYELFLAQAEATDRANRERAFEALMRRGRALGLRELHVDGVAISTGVHGPVVRNVGHVFAGLAILESGAELAARAARVARADSKKPPGVAVRCGAGDDEVEEAERCDVVGRLEGQGRGQQAGLGITLRKETSIAQMIAGYIRPAKKAE